MSSRKRGGFRPNPDAMFISARQAGGVKQKNLTPRIEKPKRKVLVLNKKLPFLKESREYRISMELRRIARTIPIGSSRDDVVLRAESMIRKSKNVYVKKSDLVSRKDLYAFFDLLVKKRFIVYNSKGIK